MKPDSKVFSRERKVYIPPMSLLKDRELSENDRGLCLSRTFELVLVAKGKKKRLSNNHTFQKYHHVPGRQPRTKEPEWTN